MINDWVTIAEDGYLTLRFRTMWGNRSQAHFVNLLMSKDAENPYEVEFRHNALVMYMVNLPTDWWHLIWIPCLTLKEKQ